MKLFVDADYIVYKACAGAESEVDFGDDVIVVVSKFSEAYALVKRELNKIRNQFMWDVPEVVLFFSDSTNSFSIKSKFFIQFVRNIFIKFYSTYISFTLMSLIKKINTT